MIFLPNQIEELLDLIESYGLMFITSNVGVSSLKISEKLKLKAIGVDWEKYKDRLTTLQKLFHFGVLSGVVGGANTSQITFEDFKKYLKSGKFIPLSEIEKNALQFLEARAHQDIISQVSRIQNILTNTHFEISGKLRKDFEREIVDEAKRAILERTSVQEMVLALGHKREDWSRDLLRISDYVLHTAFEEGKAASFKRDNKDPFVFKQVYDQACRFCIKLYNTDGVGSQPKIFRLSELEANGSNIGRKQADWKAVVGSVHPHCLSKDTEILTNNGWKFVEDIDVISDQALTYNIENKTSELSKIKAKIQYNYEGEMHHYFHDGFDLLVTSDHNLLAQDPKKLDKEKKYIDELKPSNEFTIQNLRFYRAIPNWLGSSEKVKIGNFEILPENFAAFMGYYLSEGNISKKQTLEGWTYEIKISQNKNRYFDDIFCICENIFDGIWGTGKEAVYCYTKDTIFGEYLIRLGKSWEKYVPQEILDLDKKYLEIFLEKYINGDGTRRKYDKIFKSYDFSKLDKIGERICTSSYKMTAGLSEAIMKINKAVRITERQPGNISYKKSGERIETKRVLYLLDLGYSVFSQVKKQVIKYNGGVGCIEVEKNNTIFVKRNGLVTITGNCRCTLHKLPYGYAWSDEGKGFIGSIDFERKVQRKSKIYIRVGSKKFEV